MCFASTFTDSHKKKLESGWVVPMRQGPPGAVSPTQSQLSRRGKIILLSDKDWLSNSALAHTICILPSLMLLSLVNKMLEHCRAAGDEMLGEYDDSRYLTNWPTNLQAMVNLFVFFCFYLEIAVEHPVTVQVIKGEEQLCEPPADPLASHEKAEVISLGPWTNLHCFWVKL